MAASHKWGVTIDNVEKRFGSARSSHQVLKKVSLSIEPGEFFVLLGPSGCGKSTLLNIVAGLEQPDGGTVRIGETLVADAGEKTFLSPARRDIAMVFQSYALYPHMTVRQNIAFPLTNGKNRPDPHKRGEMVEEAARLLDITELLDRKPQQLSGGQRQRVAIGRALVRKPRVFLLDEPLSNLDAKLRMEMRARLRALQKKVGITTLYVTHDQMEAMTLGDRMAVIHDGVVQQAGVPHDVYDRPANSFVAGFIGSPPMNCLSVSVGQKTDTVLAQRWRFTVPLHCRISPLPQGPCIMGFRPESVTVVEPGTGDGDIPVDSVENIGTTFLVYAFGKEEKIVVASERPPSTDTVGLLFSPQSVHFFTS